MDTATALAPYLILATALIGFLLVVQQAMQRWAWPIMRRVWALFKITEAELNPSNGGGLLSKINSHGNSLTEIKTEVGTLNGRVSEHIGIAKGRDTQLDELDQRVEVLESDRA